MRTFLSPFVFLMALLPSTLLAQHAFCDTVPFAYRADSITWGSAFPSSFGDSVLAIPIHNGTTTGFAYPQAKIVSLTPLPTGLVLREYGASWSVFASAWNPGETYPASMFFDVTAPLPPNASATFEVWLTNLAPLAIDSCKFDTTFTFNFNPQPTGIIETANSLSLQAFATAQTISVTCNGVQQGDRIFVTDLIGRQLHEAPLQSSQQISFQHHAPTVVLLYVLREKQLIYRTKLWVP